MVLFTRSIEIKIQTTIGIIIPISGDKPIAILIWLNKLELFWKANPIIMPKNIRLFGEDDFNGPNILDNAKNVNAKELNGRSILDQNNNAYCELSWCSLSK